MAGDWIKMRSELQTHPKVVRILSALEADKFRVIGGLHAVWAVFDTHSTDGLLAGYTPKGLDHVIGWPGFSDAMMKVNWLVWDGEETLSLPEFTEHNGQSAKRRAEDQKRKRNSRKSPQEIGQEVGRNADNKRTKSGLDKREDIKNIEGGSKEELLTPPAKKNGKGVKCSIPDGFEVSDRVKVWAAENGHGQLDAHLASFKKKCEAHGYQYVDWDSAFMEAIRTNWARLDPAVSGPRKVVI